MQSPSFIVPVAAMGTSVALIEKIPSGKEAIYSLNLILIKSHMIQW
jgi:DUF917 family protein